MKYIITFILILIQSIAANASDKPMASSQCAESFSKNKLLGGWYLWEPYQFNKITSSGYNLTGMDIDLVKSIAKRVGVDIL
jgi:polar amino acid transport system substrate-binding protein